jgi:dihydrofolate reductase
MQKSIIVALSQNHVIGNQGNLPWHMPNDLKYFKQLTMGHHVIMGRKTFESLPGPLPGRSLIVLTHHPTHIDKPIQYATDLLSALNLAEAAHETEVFIAGGGEVYAQALSWVDRIYMTLIDTTVIGDTFFPTLDDTWQQIQTICNSKDNRHAYDYEWIVWEKR